MLIELFKQYIKVSRGISDRSVGHYITALNTINTLLEKYEFPVQNVFLATSLAEVTAIQEFLDSNEEFLTKDSTGHNMYSVAFKHYFKFVCEDTTFFEKNICEMDIPVSKPKVITSSHNGWGRNQIIIGQAIEGAGYCCENHSEHLTFTSKSTGHPYMEGHHLIPLKCQSEFDHGIDVYANIVCLCPICHRLMHYGIRREKEYVADRLFETRAGRLKKCGISISRNDFIKLVM